MEVSEAEVYVFHTNGVIDFNKPKYRVFVYVLGLKKSQITIHGKTNKSFSSYKLLYLLCTLLTYWTLNNETKIQKSHLPTLSLDTR